MRVNRPRAASSRRRRDEEGQTIPLIIGFAVVLLLVIAMVVDSSTAYQKRQSLTNVADGAALAGADAGVSEGTIYEGGIGEGSVPLTKAAVLAGVEQYLAATGARADHPGLTRSIRVEADEVIVTITAPVDLPFTVPGAPKRVNVSATSSASLNLD